MHSLFASLTGFSFVLLATSSLFVETRFTRRLYTGAIVLLVSLLSYLIFQVKRYAGLWQRAIFVLAFTWLVFFFKSKVSLNIKGGEL